MKLGTCADGRTLTYDTALYEFKLDREVVTYAQIRELDNHAHISWLALEQRDWFRRVDPKALEACHKRAAARRGGSLWEGMTPEERVQADAARNDSVLAGKIVDADPALVQAVAGALEAQGLLGGFNGVGTVNIDPKNMPAGMELLEQLKREDAIDRKMTRGEKRMMRKILAGDDKAKERREQSENLLAEEERKAAEALADAAGKLQIHEADTEHLDVNQQELKKSAEQTALETMRERNRKSAQTAAQQKSSVPGMKEAHKAAGGGIRSVFKRSN